MWLGRGGERKGGGREVRLDEETRKVQKMRGGQTKREERNERTQTRGLDAQ